MFHKPPISGMSNYFKRAGFLCTGADALDEQRPLCIVYARGWKGEQTCQS